jgi:GGDEF domain-containing protein
VFYLCPIALGAWNFGRNAGFAIAGMSAAYSAFVAFSVRAPTDLLSQVYWQAGSTLAVFGIFAFVIAHHRRFIDLVAAHGRVDPDTGAVSRREFEHLLRQETWRATRYKRPMALVLVEVVPQKSESLSQSRLELVVATMRQGVQEMDCVARAAEARFAMLLVERTLDDTNAIAAATGEALRKRFAGKLDFRIGIVCYPGRGHVSPAKLMIVANDQLRLDANSARGKIAQAAVI